MLWGLFIGGGSAVGANETVGEPVYWACRAGVAAGFAVLAYWIGSTKITDPGSHPYVQAAFVAVPCCLCYIYSALFDSELGRLRASGELTATVVSMLQTDTLNRSAFMLTAVVGVCLPRMLHADSRLTACYSCVNLVCFAGLYAALLTEGNGLSLRARPSRHLTVFLGCEACAGLAYFVLYSSVSKADAMNRRQYVTTRALSERMEVGARLATHDSPPSSVL